MKDVFVSHTSLGRVFWGQKEEDSVDDIAKDYFKNVKFYELGGFSFERYEQNIGNEGMNLYGLYYIKKNIERIYFKENYSKFLPLSWFISFLFYTVFNLYFYIFFFFYLWLSKFPLSYFSANKEKVKNLSTK